MTTTLTPAGFLTPADAEAAAVRVLPAAVERFVNGAAGAGLTLRANRAALDRVSLVPRVLADVSSVSTAARLLGRDATFPAAVAPMAYQRAVHPGGEVAAARAARDAGVPFTVSMFSSQTVEEIAATGATTWFQLYWLHDRGYTLELVRRAEAAGCAALILTVDTPLMGRRLDDMRGSFRLPDGVTAAHLAPLLDRHRGTGSEIAGQTASVVDASLSWADVDWLRAHTTLPLILKGVLHAADAKRAQQAGVDAVVVSNHGGRQLDGAVASADALPAVAGHLPVLLDSGIRGGADILKALALGAHAVLLGRPVLWGLAAGGGDGARRVIELFREELGHCLALAGCPDLAAVRDLGVVR